MKIKAYCVVYTQFMNCGQSDCDLTKITAFDNLPEARLYYISTIINILKLDYDKLEEIDKKAIDEEIKEISNDNKNYYRDSVNDDFYMEIIESE